MSPPRTSQSLRYNSNAYTIVFFSSCEIALRALTNGVIIALQSHTANARASRALSCIEHGMTDMDATPVIMLDQLAGISIEEFLSRVFQEGTVTVQLPDGEAVTIQPKPRLQPLPVLEGYVPEEWKDEIRTCEAGFLKR